ncbi:MAG: hypothetical protein JW699_01060 [Chitinispirillaceae bacterium]|nr:hypothetical protein [Chitinispirillaceae bacterium]
MINNIAFLIFAIYCLCKADIPYIPDKENYSYENYLLGNIETLGNYEIYFKNNNTSLLFWGGYAVVYPLLENLKANYGYEYAIELRKHVSHNKNNNNFYGSIYLGNAFMKTRSRTQIHHYDKIVDESEYYESSFGISFGIKFGYQYHTLTLTKTPLLSLVLDPYFSLSGSHYSVDSGEWNTIDHPIFSLGIRLLLNYKHIPGNKVHQINIEEVK